jgi:mevalonate kinase
MIKVSAPGKCIITGEHAVVYGEPAIITAVGKRCFVEVEKSDKVRISFKYDTGTYTDETTVKEVKKIGAEAEKLWQEGLKNKDFSKIDDFAKGNKFGWVSFGYLMNKLGIDSGVSVKIDQHIPLGSGLGSSSAYSVAASLAFSRLSGKDISLEEVNKLAFGLEQFKHGMPSGGDNTTCCYGGLVWFQKNMQGGPNTISSLKKEIPHKLENFILVYTGRPEKTTGELVQMVRNLDPAFREPRVKRIGALTNEMKEALKKKDYKRIKLIMNENWTLLRGFGLSTPVADKLIDKIRKMGGAAKLCGGCGGGIMLAYHEDAIKLKSAIKKEGFEPMEVELGIEGVRVEK